MKPSPLIYEGCIVHPGSELYRLLVVVKDPKAAAAHYRQVDAQYQKHREPKLPKEQVNA